ncbi:MAG: GAF domain-containing protein [Proteobacteria bacterium]|nr:GAF domain-containing protein [Pseudomonadota bacterium]
MMHKNRLSGVMACFKGEFSLDWLLELTGLKATLLLETISDTIRQGQLVEIRSGVYQFGDENKRLRLEQSLEKGERESVCRKIVDLLKADVSDDPAKQKELSSHMRLVKNDLEGCRWLVKAGDAFNKSMDFSSATACYLKAIEDLRSSHDEASNLLFVETVDKHMQFLAVRQDSNWATTIVEEARIIEEALERADAIKHQSFQALLKMHLAINQFLRGAYELSAETFENAWQMAQEIDDPRFLKPITTISAFMSYWQGRFRRAIEIYEHSVQDVETFPRGMFPLFAATTVAHSYALIGQVSQGLGMLDAIYSHAIKTGHHNIAGYAVYNIGQILVQLGRVDEAYQTLLSLKEKDMVVFEERIRADITLLKAYVFFLKNKKEASRKSLRNYFDILESAGIPKNINGYLLLLCWAAEQGEYPPIENLSLETEIDAIINSGIGLHKGYGFRMKALLAKKQGDSAEAVLDYLDNSVKLLENAGVEVDVARARIERSRQYLEMNQEFRAVEDAREAYDVFEKYSELDFPDDLKFLVESTRSRENLLEEILRLGQDVMSIRNYRELARYIISTVTRITGAERGAVFLVKPSSQPIDFTLKAAKNLTSEDINRPEFEPHMAIVREVVNTSQGIIRKVTIEDDASHSSFGKVRSCICVPMINQGRIVGVLYNDNRFLASAFKESDLPTFTYFAALTAIAMDNAKAYDEIKRLNYKIKEEKQYYREQHLDSMHYDNFVGKSQVVLNMLGKVKQVAETDTTILIQGETGVGKELVAGIILGNSLRRDKPFICVNCSAFSETLIASELFGHEKGAFTGANERRIGRFELADGGTLFLDEIGDISMEVQVRLLRVLQTKNFERVGGTRNLKSDFRLIAATNQNLEALVKAGKFREDLYYRLNVFPIEVPPLRKRPEDISLLALFFLKKFAKKSAKVLTRIPESEMKMLESYSWPGNVRELENVMERAVVMSRKGHFHIPDLQPKRKVRPDRNGGVTMLEIEKNHLVWALNETKWKIRGPGGAAELLGMHHSTLRSRIKKHGIKKQLLTVS